MKKTLYFEICENIEELKKFEQQKNKKISTNQKLIQIKQSKMVNKLTNKINNFKYAIQTHFNLIQKIEEQEKVFYIIFASKSNDKKILNKVNKKIENELSKNPNNQIILSKQIKKLSEENKNLKNSKKNIIQQIIKYYNQNKELYFDYIEYILNNTIKLQNSTPQEQSIYILVKENKPQYTNKIIKIISNYKSINIVTPNLNSFKKLENKLEDSMDIIAISNNKRKSLSKAKYIINMDFDANEILQYSINRTAVIFNTYNTQIKMKNFDGIIINNIKLREQKKFSLQDEYIANKINKEEILKTIKNGEYELIGNNGNIVL